MSLNVTGLHVGYATAQVLHGVDLTIGANETVALLGRNGMGKTTLVRAICGLRPPTARLVEHAGQALQALGEDGNGGVVHGKGHGGS